MTRISIIDFVESKIIKSVEIELIQYNINTSAVCNVNFLDNQDNKTSSLLVYIDGDDFNTNWVNDSDLISIVLSKLGLVPLPSN
jgi:hypothetical protein